MRRVSRLGPIARLGAVAALLAAGYWTMLSSYSQLFGWFPYRGRTSAKIIALTFDDGPNEPFTSQIANFLAGEEIRATFFQVGRCAERFPGVTAELLQQGHVIGNHSYSHEMNRCLRRAAQMTETEAAQRVLTAAIGAVPMLYRPPWLLRTPTLMRLLSRHRLQPISGEFCHAFEPFQPNPERIARRALAKARPGGILIFHDGFDSRGGNRAHTVAATKIVVAELIRRGYRFVTVDELLGIPAYRPANGSQRRPGGASPVRRQE